MISLPRRWRQTRDKMQIRKVQRTTKWLSAHKSETWEKTEWTKIKCKQRNDTTIKLITMYLSQLELHNESTLIWTRWTLFWQIPLCWLCPVCSVAAASRCAIHLAPCTAPSDYGTTPSMLSSQFANLCLSTPKQRPPKQLFEKIINGVIDCRPFHIHVPHARKTKKKILEVFKKLQK